jgi:hypothetical protein
MSQEQAQVSKASAAQRASRRTRKTRGGGEPDSPWWQEAAPWYQGGNQDRGTQAGDEDGSDD